MPYVYSTLTSAQEYADWQKVEGGANTILRTVRIEGGHGVINKNFLTPDGVATQVSDDDLAFLQNNFHFKQHVENGFVTVEARKVEPEKATRDLKRRDGSSQITPDDYVKQGKKAPKIGAVGEE